MSQFSIKHIPPCIEKSISKTFEVQLAMKSKVETYTMSQQEVKTSSIECLSTLSMDSKELSGSLTIAFPKATLLKVISGLIGEEHSEINSENCDASGELLNIIYASARKSINEGGFDFAPALPTTIVGKDLALAKSNQAGTALFFDCNSDAGPFALMLSLRKKVA